MLREETFTEKRRRSGKTLERIEREARFSARKEAEADD